MPPPAVPFDRLAALGPFFALHPAGSDRPEPAGVRRLLEDAPTLDAAIDLYAGRMATTRRDIAGSLLLQGWAGRLTSAFAGCAVLSAAVPDLSATNLTYSLPAGGPVDLGLVDGTLLDVAPGWRRLVDTHLDPLVAAVDDRCGAGQRRLWGNVAAALAGSLGSLARAGVAGLDELTALPWAQPPELAGLGQWLATEWGSRYARRTCCNLVRIPGFDLCADCVITWHPRLPRLDR